jgi:hypothetical protein
MKQYSPVFGDAKKICSWKCTEVAAVGMSVYTVYDVFAPYAFQMDVTRIDKVWQGTVVHPQCLRDLLFT